MGQAPRGVPFLGTEALRPGASPIFQQPVNRPTFRNPQGQSLVQPEDCKRLQFFRGFHRASSVPRQAIKMVLLPP